MSIESSSDQSFHPDAINAEAARFCLEQGFGMDRQAHFAQEISEQRVSKAFTGLLEAYSDEEVLYAIDGDLGEAVSRYIANDDLCRNKTNPQIACSAHISLAYFWLNVVAKKPIGTQTDREAKLTALLHYLDTDGDDFDLHEDIRSIVAQLRSPTATA